VWVVKVGENSYRGTIGIADVRGIQLNRYTNLFQNNIAFSADGEKNTMLLGLKRADIDDDGDFNLVAGRSARTSAGMTTSPTQAQLRSG
jgi:hypothetical protein